MNQDRLPGESTVTTLWIISLVFLLLGCCCGILGALPSVILSTIALIVANKNLSYYNENPDAYLPSSRGLVNTGKIVSIISLIISSLVTLMYLIFYVFYGLAFAAPLYKAYENGDFETTTYDDSIYEEDENETILWEELDSIHAEKVIQEIEEVEKAADSVLE